MFAASIMVLSMGHTHIKVTPATIKLNEEKSPRNILQIERVKLTPVNQFSGELIKGRVHVTLFST